MLQYNECHILFEKMIFNTFRNINYLSNKYGITSAITDYCIFNKINLCWNHVNIKVINHIEV